MAAGTEPEEVLVRGALDTAAPRAVLVGDEVGRAADDGDGGPVVLPVTSSTAEAISSATAATVDVSGVP